MSGLTNIVILLPWEIHIDRIDLGNRTLWTAGIRQYTQVKGNGALTLQAHITVDRPFRTLWGARHRARRILRLIEKQERR